MYGNQCVSYIPKGQCRLPWRRWAGTARCGVVSPRSSADRLLISTLLFFSSLFLHLFPFPMQQPHHPAVHHHIPLTHAQALEILRKNRQMWANNPGLSKNHIGLEQVLLNAEIAIDAEFDFPQDGAQRDENVRKRLKQAERDLEAVSYWL